MGEARLGDNPEYFLVAVCEGHDACGHASEIDRKALIARFGPDIALSDLAEFLVCAKCGRRKPGFRIGWRGPPLR